MSIGYTNAISSGCNKQTMRGTSTLGGGIPGVVAQTISNVYNNSEYANSRFYLRNGFNTSYGREKTLQGVPAKINSPFRLSMNAGDPLSRRYYSCGGSPAQIKRPQNNGLKHLYGNIQNICDGTGIQPANCNGKWVYDSSDYTRYRKNYAMNKTYNNLTFGGNEFSGQQVAFKAIRRF
jgi:hypothetical protein